MDVLEALSSRFGDRVEITIFGDDPTHPDYPPLRRSFPHTSAGVIDGAGLSSLFNRVHVFADFSSYQAMGLSAMEAMGCGATAIVPSAGGASSFARHEENALVIDTSTADSCLAALVRLVEDPPLVKRLMDRGFRDVIRHRTLLAAHRTLDALFPDA
jgi:glycosyltransferase involved in cell wall biosynthesis